MSVGDPTPMDQAWQALAVEAAPAKSLARIDAASARVVSTVGTVATLLTGLGLVAAGLPATAGLPRVFAVVSVVLAFAAVLCALAAQVLTVDPDLNLNNLSDVEAWYRDLFARRAPWTRAATILIAVAAAAAGAATVVTLATAGADSLTLAVTRTAELPEPTAIISAPNTSASGMTASPSASAGEAGTVTAGTATSVTVVVEAIARGLTPGQPTTLSVTAASIPLAEAVVVAGPDGVAEKTLTIAHVPAQAAVTVTAHAAETTCTSQSLRGAPPSSTCN